MTAVSWWGRRSMPRRCTICTHDEREAIDKALVARETFRHIAARFSVSTSALVRHCDDHLPTDLLKAKDAADVANADALLAQVCDLRDKALGVLTKAENTDDLRCAVAAIREARGCVELLAKLAGQISDAPVVNVFLSEEWRMVQAALLTALEPYAEARVAAVQALDKMPCVGHA